ncbi:glycine-rich domain-containing protein [Gluconobacter potus]|uniref:glycine-rich domain-containing protein n=1 Tax=Gluconobacter potus TaxID=2724927 RepID=UPI000782C722|nr:hypothetical protein [Gluconobacter potus]
MDRKIIYPAQIPLVEDQLQAARFTQIGIGRISGALYGEGGTGASGFACTPVSGMIVSVAPGQIVSPGVVDTTSYGVLAADSSPLPIQYILPDATQVTVPSTAGTYIIYATPSVTDTTPAVLPFYNSATPTQVYAGPDNDGSSTDTIRSSQITLGIAATVPSGSVPLWSVTVASGVTAITADMISVASAAPFYPSLAATAPRTVAPFNAALAAAMGGYPLNAIVADPSTAGKYWRSTADANLTVPGASGASWVDFFSGVQSGRLLSVTNYTANTTYTPSASATKILVEMVGPGGAAGGCPAAAGTNYASVSTAGAAGAFIRALFDLSTITLSAVPLTIGAGGVGAEGANGGTGGSTLFGTWLTAKGGAGGAAGTSTAPGGGGWTSQSGGGSAVISAAAGLTVLDAVQGANGMNGLLVPNGSNPGLPLPALGTNSPFGTGGNNSVNTTSTAITTDAPRGYGSGSGASGSQLGATTGGTGASGLIRIWEYS